MKLLISELEVLRTYVSREFYHVMRALITDFNWQHVETRELWNDSGRRATGRARRKSLGRIGEIAFRAGYFLAFFSM